MKLKLHTNPLSNLFTFDLRSLSLMRIAVALTLLVDLVVRAGNFKAHYSNQGVLPLEALFRFAWNEHFFSFYTLSGSALLQGIVVLLNLICIFFLLIGYRTKLFSILCWLFLLSIHNRNPLIQQGGDDLLRLILFWGIFLPWGHCYSFDSEKKEENSGFSCVSYAGFAYMLQVGYVYFFSAILKSSVEWTSEYSALYYALSLDQMILPLGRLIYPYENVLMVITMIVYYIELLIPLLLLIPLFTRQLRNTFILVICLLHIGISLCLNVGLFPLIGIVSLIGLLDGSFSQRIADSFRSFYPWIKETKIYLQKIFNYRFSTAQQIKDTESIYQKAILLFCALYVLNWNLFTVNLSNLIPVVGKEIAYVTRLDQNWGMFSPSVFKDDGWFIFSATTESGKKVDILKEGRELSFVKYASVIGPFREDRWRKYSENILLIKNSHFRPYYCSYLLNGWNTQNPLKIKSLQIIYMKEISLPGYSVKGPSKEILCECY